MRRDECYLKMQRKALIVVAVLTISIFVILYAVANLVLLRSFIALEEQETGENVIRTRSALSNEFSDMDAKVTDWAFWDETYFFIQDKNLSYVDLNLADSTFANLRLNLMLFVNSSGQVVYAEAFSLSNGTPVPIPDSVIEQIATHSLLWNFSSAESETVGLILLPEQPTMIASKPILTSQEEGPIKGALIFGRYLDLREIGYLRNTVNLPLTVNTINGSQMPADFQIASSKLSDDALVFVRALDADNVAGYTLIKDIYGKPAVVLRADNYRDIYHQGLLTVSYFSVSAFGICLAFSATIMVWLHTGVLSPLSRLTAAIKQMGRSLEGENHASRLGTDEMVILSQAMKDAVSQRLAAIEELAGMIGHDLRNPLTGISGAAYYIKTRYASQMDDRGKEMLRIIENDIAYSNKIINDLLEYSRKVKLDLTETSPKSLIDESLSLVAVPGNVQLVDHTQQEPTFAVDVDKLKRALTNVIKNAFDAMPTGGLLTIRSRKLNQSVEFTFTDTGAGMSRETLQKLWDPLFTTKAKGMGFGLPISKRFIEAHGGQISVASASGKGTTVTVTIPTREKVRSDIQVCTETPYQTVNAQEVNEA